MSTTAASDDDARWDAGAELLDRAAIALDDGDLARAQALAQDARGELVAVLGEAHPDVANCHVTFGEIAAARGDLVAALAELGRGVAILAAFRDEPEAQPSRARALGRLGEVLVRAGRYDEAEPVLAEAVAAGEHDRELLAWLLCAQGVGLKLGGKLAAAAHAYGRAAELLDPEPAALLHNLAGLACAEGDFVRAEELARAAIAARLRETDGAPGLDVATDLAGLGDALAGQQRFSEAAASYRDALDRLEQVQPDHIEIAYALHNLGDALASLGELDEADRSYREALARKQAAFGASHPEVAATLANLASLLDSRGARHDAAELAAQAVAIARDTLRADHPIRVGCEQVARSLA